MKTLRNFSRTQFRYYEGKVVDAGRLDSNMDMRTIPSDIFQVMKKIIMRETGLT